MTEIRTWTADEARVAVANAMGRKLGRGAVNLDAADEVLGALGISGDVTLVPGRLVEVGDGHLMTETDLAARGHVRYERTEQGWTTTFVEPVPPHAEPGQR